MSTEPDNDGIRQGEPEAPAPGPPTGSAQSISTEGHSPETQLLQELTGDLHLVTVVVLVGASALIPVPFLDDFAKRNLERRLLRTVARREGMTLAKEEIDRLTQEPPSGCCALGCLGNAFLYPIKRVLRKVFFFLEIKRSMDQSSTALAEAWLFALALRRGLWSPGRDLAEADRLRGVMEASCQSQGVKPLETAVRRVFEGAKGTLVEIATRFTGQGAAGKDELDAAVKKLEVEESERLTGLSQKLREALSGVSETYLQRFAEGFGNQLEAARQRPPVA